MESRDVEHDAITKDQNYNYPDSSKSSKYLTTSWSSEPNQDVQFSNSRRYYRSKSLVNLSTQGFAGDYRVHRDRLLRTQPNPQPALVKKFSNSQKMTLVSLALVDFMSFCSMSIMAPFYPREAAEKGMSETVSGFVFAFYALIMFISSPFFGKILPTVGPKFLFMSGMFIAGFCNLLFGLLEYINDYTLFTVFSLLVRGVEALGASAYSTASYVFVVHTFPDNIGAVIGLLETFVGLGMSIGPAIGGLLYSLGGFGLPFYVLGILMVLVIPFNICLLPQHEECAIEPKRSSVWQLVKVPAVMVIGLVVVVVSNAWGFLDPTLEPHLRQFSLTPEKVGLMFLLLSGVYGASSPAWGWLGDKWGPRWGWPMMASGLGISTVGLLLLGPSPLLSTMLKPALWLDITALSLLGAAVALALLPTFPALLHTAISGGCEDSLSTYSLVAGVWSCMYSLGEVTGPALGGLLLQHTGFPTASSVMAGTCFLLALVTLVFWWIVERRLDGSDVERSSDSGISASWNSSCGGSSAEDDLGENQPLLAQYRTYTQEKVSYYGKSRRNEQKEGEHDTEQLTDVRGTVNITSGGACEV